MDSSFLLHWTMLPDGFRNPEYHSFGLRGQPTGSQVNEASRPSSYLTLTLPRH